MCLDYLSGKESNIFKFLNINKNSSIDEIKNKFRKKLNNGSFNSLSSNKKEEIINYVINKANLFNKEKKVLKNEELNNFNNWNQMININKYNKRNKNNNFNFNNLQVENYLVNNKQKGTSKFIFIKGIGKRKIRYQKNGKTYVIINRKKIKLN